MNREKMANYLIELRKGKDLSQASLAELMGVTFQAVSKWERSEAIPDITILEQLSKLYGVTIDEIINGEPKKIVVDTPIVTKKKSFFNQNRSYGVWFSLGFMILFVIFGFLPYVQTGLYFQFLFSNLYSLGNYFLLLQFLVVMSIPIITMLFNLNKNKKSFTSLFKARTIIIIIALVLSGLLIPYIIVTNFSDLGVGFFLPNGLILAFMILCLTLKVLKKNFLLKDFEEENLEELQELDLN